MQHYCGIDLHSNNHVVVIIDEEDKRVFERRLSNDLSQTLKALEPYQNTLNGIAVESTFNWYWLVDGLQAHGYQVKLVNTCAVVQYDGLKYSGDQHDAFHLAHLMRLGILPTGYIYPKEQRAVRDLLRRRLSLVRMASAQLIGVQSQLWRSIGIRISPDTLRRQDFKIPLEEGHTRQAIESGLAVYQAIQREIDTLEQSAYQAVKLNKAFEVLQTVRGIGKILGLTIMLETGAIFTDSPMRGISHRIAGVSTAHEPAMVRRKAMVTPRRAINTFRRRFQRPHILQCALNRWHNDFMNARKPKQMASSPSEQSPASWHEPAG